MPNHYRSLMPRENKPRFRGIESLFMDPLNSYLSRPRGAGNQQKRGRGGTTRRPSASSRPATAATSPMQLVAPANSRQQPMQLVAPANPRQQMPALPQPTVSPAMRFGAVRPSPASPQPAVSPESRAKVPTRSDELNRMNRQSAEDMADIRATVDSMRDYVNNPPPNPEVKKFYADLQEGYENMVPSNYRDMTERGQARRRSGINDNFVMPRSAKQNFDSKLANMSPEELKKEAFTSRQSGVRGSGPYGGRATYTQPGGMSGREAALAGSSLDYGAGTGPVEKPPRKSADTGTVVGYEQAKRLFGSNVEPGSTQVTPNGTRVTVGLDTKDPFRALDGNSVLLGVQGRFGGPRRDGEVRQGPNGEYVPGGNLNNNEKFMAQRDRRAQRREDALATRRSMLPYRTRGIPMNAIFLDQEGMADPLMNAGMFQEASRRDQIDARDAEARRQFDANLRLQTRQQKFSEDEALRRERQNRRDDRRQRRQDRRTYRDGEERRRQEDEALKIANEEARQRMEIAREQATREQEQDGDLDTVVDYEVQARERDSLQRLNPNTGPVPAEDDYNGRVEHINNVLSSTLDPQVKQRILADIYGITSAEQAREILGDSDYADEWFFGDGLFMWDDEEPYRRRYNQRLDQTFGG